jgi:hypothetical protein
VAYKVSYRLVQAFESWWDLRTDTQQGDLISLPLFLQNKESRLKEAVLLPRRHITFQLHKTKLLMREIIAVQSNNHTKLVNILSRVGVLCVTYKMGSGLDDLIYCTLYIHATRKYRQLQRYRYSTHFPVHRYTRTRVLRLH